VQTAAGPGRACASCPASPKQAKPARRPKHGPGAGAAGLLTAFLQELWPDARAKGVTRATFDMAFAGVTPTADHADSPTAAGFGQSVGTYIANFASKSRIETGMRKGREHAATLTPSRALRRRPLLLLAIWGLRTNFAACAIAGMSSARSPARVGALAPSVLSRRADQCALILQEATSGREAMYRLDRGLERDRRGSAQSVHRRMLMKHVDTAVGELPVRCSHRRHSVTTIRAWPRGRCGPPAG